MTLSFKPRLFHTISMFLAFLFTSVGTLHAEKLRVAYTAFAGTFTILWVGKEAGLYQKHGVDMDLLFIGSSTRAVQALLGGTSILFTPPPALWSMPISPAPI
jgi:ABC-type nitrate/sulfonate/bicarbonate transport system substrate-binding protein